MPWFAIYTKSRCEKKVHEALEQKGIESYCPLTKVVRQWSDRVKKIEQPLFTSYVFVNVTQVQQSEVRQTNGVVNFVYWLGKPAVIPLAEIDAIKKFVDGYEKVSFQKLLYKPGQKIEVAEGVFKGQNAIVQKVYKTKIELILPLLQAKLVVPIK